MDPTRLVFITLSGLQPWSVGPTTPASHSAIILHCVVPRTRRCVELGTLGRGSVLVSHLQTPTSRADPLKTLAYVSRAYSGAGPEWSGTNL